MKLLITSVLLFFISFSSTVFLMDGLNHEVKAESKIETKSVSNIVQAIQIEGVDQKTIKQISIGHSDPTIDMYIQREGKIIIADLKEMKMELFENGELVDEFAILSKGREGSRWETPTGFYKIEKKLGTAFSSIGEVYMPYSMQFFANFFIHGWPYYPGGKPVPVGYSGGCIRLSDENAKKVYQFSEQGIGVYVVEDRNIKIYDSANDEIDVSAKSYIVADIENKKVLAERNSYEKRPIASISKLITASVVNEAITYDRKIKIDKASLDTYGDSGQFVENEEFTATELLYPLLMVSSNDAGEAFARAYGRTKFIELMNKKVESLNMHDSSFEDPTGFSANNVSTPRDLLTLIEYLYNKEKFLLDISKTKEKKVEDHIYTNFNHFSSYKEFLGGKTGYITASGETMVSLFEINGKKIAIIVLNSKDRKTDILKIKEWVEKQ